MGNERRNRDHDGWRHTMREVWEIEPGLIFCATKGQHMVALAGTIRDERGYPRPANDPFFTS